MAPIQILTNNLLYDFSQVPIPTDQVEPEQIARPRPWSMGQITRFILFIGPCSSIFDYTTFLMMMFVFKAFDPSRASLFQTGWFVESLRRASRGDASAAWRLAHTVRRGALCGVHRLHLLRPPRGGTP